LPATAPPKPATASLRYGRGHTCTGSFECSRLSRVHPPDKKVLEDISLSFLPGAKIGVLGPNGSGKSTLLRIMAGQDTEFRGDAQLAPGATVGLLEQEPQLDPSKDVRGNVEDGVRELRDMLDRFNELQPDPAGARRGAWRAQGAQPARHGRRGDRRRQPRLRAPNQRAHRAAWSPAAGTPPDGATGALDCLRQRAGCPAPTG
jgi:ATPase subunit of ABC transporter with duplicated ATPase domains